jgi:hypothetical protein
MRYLTDNLSTLNVSSAEKSAILNIRQAIPQFSRSEAVALVILLLNSYSATLDRWLAMAAARNFNQGLTTAVLQISTLSAAAKLRIAIELLKLIEAQSSSEEKATQEEEAQVDN